MHFTKFDFLTLWVKEGARQTNIDWYVNHLGLTVGWDSPGEKLTLLNFPSKQALTLLAHYPEDSLLPEGEVRVCLTTRHLDETRLYFGQERVHTTGMYQTPWRADAFDFFDLQGTRLTVTSLPAVFESKQHQEHRFYSYFLHLVVSDLTAAKQWYPTFLGMSLIELPDSKDYLMMRMPEDEQVQFPIFLSEGNNSRNRNRPNEPVVTAVRPFFQLSGKPQLEKAHAIFSSNGIEISEISGKPDDFMRWFDFADPSGNQLHAIAY